MEVHKFNFRISLLAIVLLSGILFSEENLVEPVWVDNNQVVFENQAPMFFVGTSATSPKEMHWQISHDPDFIGEDLVFEDVYPYSKNFTLPAIAEGLLAEKEQLFFRARIHTDEGWSRWSTPAIFSVIRPEAYVKNRYVSEAVWSQVSPYLLPEDHPIKPVLDRIFSKERVTLSLKSLKKAGFHNTTPRKWTHLIVTKHPDVPGYVFKMYLDAQRYFKQKPEHVHWLERILGAQMIDAEIKKHGWDPIIKAPRKWIYPLPADPSPPKEFIRKNFILVEEDMNIYDRAENYEKWKSDWITKEKLDIVYALLEKCGLHDCAKPDNIPFSRDGKISFVDTQTFNRWPVLYKKLLPFLTPPMQNHWKQLTK